MMTLADVILSLKSANLWDSIKDDLSGLGCVGEDENKLLGYVIATSRKLDNPLSMIVVSGSGSGKSTLADVLESVTAPEDCIHLSRITPQALYYMGRDALKHKLVIIEERAGSVAADYSLRALQSKGRLTLLAPQRDSSNKMVSKSIEVEGPTTTIETTTDKNINPENASRCFIVHMDESVAQTERIHDLQKRLKTIEGRELLATQKSIKLKHHAMQNALENIPVHIPFVQNIDFPTSGVHARRDHAKFLNLIEAICFLHQYQRRRVYDSSGQACIEADISDYRRAYSLFSHMLKAGAPNTSVSERSFLRVVQKVMQTKSKTRFTRREAIVWAKLPDHTVRVLITNLIHSKALNVLKGRNGQQYVYELTQSSKDNGHITTPDELSLLIKQPSKTHSKPRVVLK